MKTYKLLLTTVFIEGLLAFIWLFAERSMQRNAFLFGFSALRISLGVLTLFALAFFAWWMTMAFKNHRSVSIFDRRLEYFKHRPDHLLVAVTSLGLAILAFLAILVLVPLVGPLTSTFISPRFDDSISTIIAIISRSKPLIIWALLTTIQTAAFLIYRFRNTWCQPGFFSLQPVYYLALTTLIFPMTLFHWAILYYQLYIFVAIPYWFWKFYDKPSVNNWLIFPLSMVALLLVGLVLWFPQKTRRNLIFLMVIGYMFQVGFGYIEDTGFERLRRNFIEKGHHGYAQYAVGGTSLVELISNYETIAESDPFFMTKPPGVVSFYVVANHFSSFLVDNSGQPPETLADIRYGSLTHLLSVVFPFLAVLVLIPLFALSKHLLGKYHANQPGLLFIFIPSFILTPLYLDQGFYPFLFIVGILTAFQILKNNTLGWALATGVVAYIAVFFSFSLLPLIPLALLWIGLDYLFNIKKRSLAQTIKVILAFFLGFLILHLLFKLLLDYDFILRYQNALTQHRLHKDYLSGWQQITDAALLNNTEFAAWLGFPVVILFLSALGRTLVTCLHRKAEQKDTLLIAFLFTFIMLNLMGQTRSEVARLWLFMVPVVSFFASTEVRYLLSGLLSEKHRFTYGYLYVCALQLGTIFLTFKFQDLD
jgi:hypothetical protein